MIFKRVFSRGIHLPNRSNQLLFAIDTAICLVMTMSKLAVDEKSSDTFFSIPSQTKRLFKVLLEIMCLIQIGCYMIATGRCLKEERVVRHCNLRNDMLTLCMRSERASFSCSSSVYFLTFPSSKGNFVQCWSGATNRSVSCRRLHRGS